MQHGCACVPHVREDMHCTKLRLVCSEEMKWASHNNLSQAVHEGDTMDHAITTHATVTYTNDRGSPISIEVDKRHTMPKIVSDLQDKTNTNGVTSMVSISLGYHGYLFGVV